MSEFEDNLRQLGIPLMCLHCGHATCENCRPVFTDIGREARKEKASSCCKCGKETENYR